MFNKVEVTHVLG